MSEKLRAALAAARQDERREMLAAIDAVERQALDGAWAATLRESIEARAGEQLRASGSTPLRERVREYAAHCRQHADEVTQLLGGEGRSVVYEQLARDMADVLELLGIEPLSEGG